MKALLLLVLPLFLTPLANAPTATQFTVSNITAPWNIVLHGYDTWYTVSYTVTNTGRNSTYWATFQIGSWEPCPRTTPYPIARNQSFGESCIFSSSNPSLPEPGSYGTFFWVNGTLVAFGPSIFISTSLAGQGSGGHRYAV